MPYIKPLPQSKLRRTEDPYQLFVLQIFKQAIADIKFAKLPQATYADKYWGRQARGWIVKRTGTFNLVVFACDIEPFDIEPTHFYSWSLQVVENIKNHRETDIGLV